MRRSSAFFNQYHRLVLPHIGAQQPAAHHLFGRQVMVRSTAVEFQHKVACQRVEGRHTVVVHHLLHGQRVGLGAVKGRQRAVGQGRHGAKHYAKHQQAALAQQRVTEQTSHLLAAVGHHHEH